MTPQTSSRNRDPEWLGLGEASRLLGVNESTLRRWADAGLVRTFRTPGGHRRFSPSDLQRLMDSPSEEVRQFDDHVRQRIRDRLEQDAGAPSEWLDGMSTDVRQQLGALGRETVALVDQYLTPDGDRSALETEATTIGTHYATVLRSAQITLPNAVAAFSYFRRGMDASVRAYAHEHGLSTDEADGLWERVSVLEDQMLIALTSAYQTVEQPTPAGGNPEATT